MSRRPRHSRILAWMLVVPIALVLLLAAWVWLKSPADPQAWKALKSDPLTNSTPAAVQVVDRAEVPGTRNFFYPGPSSASITITFSGSAEARAKAQEELADIAAASGWTVERGANGYFVGRKLIGSRQATAEAFQGKAGLILRAEFKVI